ncbi:hypothetical protein AgCh_019328 [Apium graveolens]
MLSSVEHAPQRQNAARSGRGDLVGNDLDQNLLDGTLWYGFNVEEGVGDLGGGAGNLGWGADLQHYWRAWSVGSGPIIQHSNIKLVEPGFITCVILPTCSLLHIDFTAKRTDVAGAREMFFAKLTDNSRVLSFNLCKFMGPTDSISEEVMVLKKKCVELEKSILENGNADKGKEDVEGKVLKLMVKNKVPECEKRKAESAYVQNADVLEALSLLKQIDKYESCPNHVTMVSVLSACAQIGDLEHGVLIHDYMKSKGWKGCLALNRNLNTTLIDMHCKCGDTKRARDVFGGMFTKDVVSFNVMITGLAINGKGQHELTNIYLPKLEHYAYFVDLLSRSGCIQEALEVDMSMPYEPNGFVWKSLLAGLKREIGILEIGQKEVSEVGGLRDGSSVIKCSKPLQAESAVRDNTDKVHSVAEPITSAPEMFFAKLTDNSRVLSFNLCKCLSIRLHFMFVFDMWKEVLM